MIEPNEKDRARAAAVVNQNHVAMQLAPANMIDVIAIALAASREGERTAIVGWLRAGRLIAGNDVVCKGCGAKAPDIDMRPLLAFVADAIAGGRHAETPKAVVAIPQIKCPDVP